MSDFGDGVSMGSSRGTGPWPSSNDERSVRIWLKSRISRGVEGEERDPVVRLCLDFVSKMERGERLMNNYRFPESEIDRLAVMADRMSKGEPVQYIMGAAHFDGHNYNVDSRVLIPRPETEELVFSIVEKLKDSEKKGKVLDIGTGSGCIALAIKKRLPEWEVFASDFSEGAIEVAKENSELIESEVGFECSDIFQKRPFENRVFDAVVSNPPYIPEHEKNDMEHRVVEYEPISALFVPNNDPLLFYKRIIELCEGGMLKSGGWLALECHMRYVKDVAELFRVLNTNWGHVSVIEDLQGKPRHVLARIDLY
jgi:release factor glutamine methyltransferase